MKRIYIIFKNDFPEEAWHNPTKAQEQVANLNAASDQSIMQGIYHIKTVWVIDL